MKTFLETPHFSHWLVKLKDLKGRMAIIHRLERAQSGHFGDVKSVGERVFEIRVDVGPGYRVYYTLRGDEVVLLLIGGDKGTQERDIAKAKTIAKEYLP